MGVVTFVGFFIGSVVVGWSLALSGLMGALLLLWNLGRLVVPATRSVGWQMLSRGVLGALACSALVGVLWVIFVDWSSAPRILMYCAPAFYCWAGLAAEFWESPAEP